MASHLFRFIRFGHGQFGLFCYFEQVINSGRYESNIVDIFINVYIDMVCGDQYSGRNDDRNVIEKEKMRRFDHTLEMALAELIISMKLIFCVIKVVCFTGPYNRVSNSGMSGVGILYDHLYFSSYCMIIRSYRVMAFI